MRLSLDALQVLDAIDRRGSFAAAAEELFRVPSAVTYTVQKLEQDLDVALFDRTGHRARLTAAGQELLESGRHLLRAAADLECRVRRVATGWETELSIAYDDILPLAPILRVVDEFCRAHAAPGEGGTRLKLSSEVLGGTWDALVSGRADLVIGAPGEGPAGGGYSARPLAVPEFVFAMAPQHPLALLPEPLAEAEIVKHRAVAVADSSRSLPPRTVGLLSGQDVLTVPNSAAKLAAQIAGLGVGYIARHLATPALAEGRLVARQVADAKPAMPLHLAWHSGQPGKALKWFVKRLSEPDFAAGLLGPTAAAASRAAPSRRPALRHRQGNRVTGAVRG